MAFATVPKESRNQINKAGAILVRDTQPLVDLNWRSISRTNGVHAMPIP